MADSKKMTAIAISALEDRKADDIRVIDITEVSVIADYFIIASGTNALQVQALADSAAYYLQLEEYDFDRQVLENHLLEE